MRLYRAILHLLPRDFREQHAAELEEVVRAHLEGASPVRRVRFMARAAVDVLLAAVRLRLRSRPRSAERGVLGRALPFTQELASDVGFAARSLRRRHTFSIPAIAVIGIGVAATTMIFSVVHGVLLRPLPYPAGERIGVLWHHFGDGAQSLPVLNPLDYFDYQEWNETFESLTIGVGSERIIDVEGDASIAQIGWVESGFFDFFGARPVMGRGFGPSDDLPGAPPVALLSHRAWVGQFDADTDVVGRRVGIDGVVHEVVGVLPEDFRLEMPSEAIFLKDAEIWAAAADRLDPGNFGARTLTLWTAFARIGPDQTFDRAQEDLNRMTAQLRETWPRHEDASLRAEIVKLRDDVVKDVTDGLVLLFVAVGMILFVACANAANLLLARGRLRESELAVRRALGASRARLFRLVLIESAVIAVIGGALGALLAVVGLDAVRWVASGSLPRLEAVTMDRRVAAFAIGCTVLAALLSGLLPASRAGKGHAIRVMGGARRTTSNRSTLRFQAGLVQAQVAIGFVVLVGAAFLLRSFASLQRIDPGFATEGVVTFRVALPPETYPTSADRRAYYDALDLRIGALPGVQEVGAVNQLPLTGSGYLAPYAYDEETAENWESTSADWRWVTPGYFDAIGARVIEGRGFTPFDLVRPDQVVVIGSELAGRAFPDGRAVGQLLQVAPNTANEARRYAEIVGVVSHIHMHDLTQALLPQIYRPMGFAGEFSGREHFGVVVRADAEFEELEPALQREAEALGRGVAVQDLAQIEETLASARAPARTLAILMVLFGGAAATLATVGLYGVLSSTVSERTKEIGIRIALGQGRTQVRGLVMGRGLRLVLVSLGLGAIVAVVTMRAAASFLVGVDPMDLWTYLLAAGVLTGCSVLACWVPAARATRIAPLDALRVE